MPDCTSGSAGWARRDSWPLMRPVGGAAAAQWNPGGPVTEGTLCVCVGVISEELRQLLTHNELQIRAIQTLWEQHLQEALKDWEQQYANITQVTTKPQVSA